MKNTLFAKKSQLASKPQLISLAIAGLAGAAAAASCSSSDETLNLPNKQEDTFGSAQVALTNTPDDVKCLRITSAGSSRSDVRAFDLEPNENAVFDITGLPTGNITFQAESFNVSCSALVTGVNPTWYSEPVVARLRPGVVKHVALLMIRNGQASIGVDFDDTRGTSDQAPTLGACAGSTFSSESRSYIIPSVEGVTVAPIFTVGDSANLKSDSEDPYRFVGLPDGMGGFDNGDGTFTLLMTHELGNGSGIERAHRGRGAFVSKWTICKADLGVLHIEDLIQEVVLWNPSTSSYDAPTTGVAFGRFCSADLPDEEATYDFATGTGYDGRIFTGGEEIGANGRATVHTLDGLTYEFPRMGKASWENVVLSPKPGLLTVAAGLDDSGGGQVYVYAGTKTSEGSPMERAGLTNGTLYGVAVDGQPVEDNSSGFVDGTFSMVEFGNVENWDGSALDDASAENGVTGFNRPEDGAWDPNNYSHLYFVTTASFSGNSRLYRIAFTDINRPELGGEFEMLLDGSEGQHMFDNLTLDRYGRVYLQEDPGGNSHLAKLWRYDIATDDLVEVATHNPVFFDSSLGDPSFLTTNEESSGIFDASHILGRGTLILNVQAHYGLGGELVEGGQLNVMVDPAAAGF